MTGLIPIPQVWTGAQWWPGVLHSTEPTALVNSDGSVILQCNRQQQFLGSHVTYADERVPVLDEQQNGTSEGTYLQPVRSTREHTKVGRVAL